MRIKLENWFDNQTNKEKFLKKTPDSLLSVVNPVEKATGIYKFIQEDSLGIKDTGLREVSI